ncbi:MAG: hypothetical protein QOD05_67 [Microbacteriaceae bacterium]|nr:hypothetical protein [Microbacteriaceae bacterium]
MNDTRFTQLRSDSIRSLLVEMVEDDAAAAATRRPSRRRWFVAGAIAFGAVASVGAAAVVADHAGWIALPSTDPSAAPSYAPIPSWPVNANGQTYGQQGNSPVAPDLILVDGTTATGGSVLGYVYSKELADADGPMPTSPAQAIERQEERKIKYPNGHVIHIPVYKSDGKTVVGYFQFGP